MSSQGKEEAGSGADFLPLRRERVRHLLGSQTQGSYLAMIPGAGHGPLSSLNSLYVQWVILISWTVPGPSAQESEQRAGWVSRLLLLLGPPAESQPTLAPLTSCLYPGPNIRLVKATQ